MKKLYIAILVLTSAGLFFSGCVKNDLVEENSAAGAISFQTNISPKSDVKCPDTKESLVCTFDLTSEDGSITIPVGVFESDLVSSGTVTGAKGSLVTEVSSLYASAYNSKAPYSQYFPFQPAEWKDPLWHLTPARYWPQEGQLDIYAYANMPDSKYASITVDPSAHTQTLDYTVPRLETDQKDILMATYEGRGNKQGIAQMYFYHPLCAVQFGHDETEAQGIKKVTMSGVLFHGTAEQDFYNPETFKWTVDDEEATVIQDNDGKPFEVHGEIDGNPFLLIPQRLMMGHEVNLTVLLMVNGHDVPLNAVINSINWEAGKTYTYKIGFKGALEINMTATSISQTESNEAVITNVGTKKCYVRATVLGYVTDAFHNIKRTWFANQGKQDGAGVFVPTGFGSETDVWNDYWIKGADNFYYYKKPLEIDESTTPLYDSYVFNGLTSGEYFELKLSSQAIEYDLADTDHKSYVKQYWGEDAASLLLD